MKNKRGQSAEEIRARNDYIYTAASAAGASGIVQRFAEIRGDSSFSGFAHKLADDNVQLLPVPPPPVYNLYIVSRRRTRVALARYMAKFVIARVNKLLFYLCSYQLVQLALT